MKTILDLVVLLVIRVVCGACGVLPTPLRELIMRGLFRAVFVCMPKARHVALKNLEVAFPKMTVAERTGLYWRSVDNLAFVLADFSRLSRLTREWFIEHVDFPGRSAYEILRERYPDSGIMIVTGHLGSFELLAYSAPFLGRQLSMVVRNFTLPALDAWWNSRREEHGNKVISRRGAVQAVIQDLRAGRDVGILFDQNVTRKHAVFVPFFGVEAATTKTVAIAALRAEAPIAVVALHRRGPDDYLLDFRPCSIDDLVADGGHPNDWYVEKITARVSAVFESMVAKYPEGWFWLHRRYRTRPIEGEPSIY